MDCPACGRTAEAGDLFCGECGYNLGTLGAPSDPQVEAPAESHRPGRKVYFFAGLLVVAGAIGTVIALTGPNTSDRSTDTGLQTAATLTTVASPGATPGEIFLEPAAATGPDPFTGELFADPVVTTTAPVVSTSSTETTATTSPGQVVVGGETGDRPGLFGGTRDNAQCDGAAILTFLQANQDKAGAWAAALNADPTLSWSGSPAALAVADLPAYFADLTPVTLLLDTRVTNHGFRNGRPTPRQSVLQAGTAVLVDRLGVPRSRCACGNPLAPPQASPTTPGFVGEAWPGFAATDLVAVQPASDPVDEFVLADLQSGEEFTREVGAGPAAQPSPTGVLVNEPVDEPYPPGAGIGLDEAYDTATFTVELDPETLTWMAFSGFDDLVDQPMGERDRQPDGVLDVVFPDVDDFLVIVATKDGVDSGPYVIHDRDAVGTPIGNQAVIYGYHPSVWYVSKIDWSADPVLSYTTTGPETGEMTSFIDSQGAGTYTFEVTFYNKWTDRVAHGALYFLAG
jgi:hypothetical protein